LTLSSNGFAATCSSNPSRSGRDGLLRLGFERRASAPSDAANHITALRHCRYTLPLQVLSPLTLDDGTSYLLLLNPTGGVLGGDRLRTEIDLGEHAAVCLSTPSATRIYRTGERTAESTSESTGQSASKHTGQRQSESTSGPPAEIHTVLRLAPGATLEYLPDHVIPHAGSHLRQTLRIEMQQGSRGIFLDAFAAGRVARNEHWQFREFHSRTEVALRDKLIYLSRTNIAGAAQPATSHSPLVTRHSPPSSLGCMSTYSYCASLLIVADSFPDWHPVLASLRAELEAVPGVIGGASLLTEAGCSVRYLASSAIALQEATRRLWAAARREVLHLPPFDPRKY
jgi:urease accessory protein